MRFLKFAGWSILFVVFFVALTILFRFGLKDYQKGAETSLVEFKQWMQSPTFWLSDPPEPPKKEKPVSMPLATMPGARLDGQAPGTSEGGGFVPAPGISIAQYGIPEGMATCFLCDGTGEAPCPDESCDHGTARCRADCIKRDEGIWEGHAKFPGQLVRKFTPRSIGAGDVSLYVNTGNVGNIIEYDKDGKPRVAGKCPKCDGTTKVPCPTCGGKQHVSCSLCGGEKRLVVPPHGDQFVDPAGKADPAISLIITAFSQEPVPFIFTGVSGKAPDLRFAISRQDRSASYTLGLKDPIPDQQFAGYHVAAYKENVIEKEDPTIRDADGNPYKLTVDKSTLLVEGPQQNYLLLLNQELISNQYSARLKVPYQIKSYRVSKGSMLALAGVFYEVLNVEPGSNQAPVVTLRRVDNQKEFKITQYLPQS
jgi:hypothetical protein